MEDGSMNNKTISGMKCIVYLFGSLVLTLPAQAASFDCDKAASKIEKLICGDNELSKLDETLSKTYQQALERNDDKQKATKEQRQWLKEVRNACRDMDCLKAAYQERINKLDMMAGQALAHGSDKGNTAQAKASHPSSQKTSLCTPESLCDKVTLMYSEDDSICKPLLQVYQLLRDKNKIDKEYKARSKAHPSFKGYWEDYYPEVFIKAGFVPPLPLRDEQHKYIPTESSKSGELASVYYRLKLDQNVAAQTVLLQDYSFAGHGDYSSSVYISKPGEDISTECHQDFSLHDSASPDAYGEICSTRNSFNQLAFAADFRFDGEEDIHAETLISHEYYFEKENTDEKFSKVLLGEIVPIDIGINNSKIQRVYLFHNQPIFTARVDGDAVVYRIKNSSQMDDVCYFASNVVRNSH
jgi:uncharacterized protein